MFKICKIYQALPISWLTKIIETVHLEQVESPQTDDNSAPQTHITDLIDEKVN